MVSGNDNHRWLEVMAIGSRGGGLSALVDEAKLDASYPSMLEDIKILVRLLKIFWYNIDLSHPCSGFFISTFYYRYIRSRGRHQTSDIIICFSI